jgi:hypothetical protein
MPSASSSPWGTSSEVLRPRTSRSTLFYYLGRDQLIAEKRYFDRPQDRADVVVLLDRAKRAVGGRKKPARKKGVPARYSKP